MNLMRKSGLALLAGCMVILFASCGTGSVPAGGSDQKIESPAVAAPDETQRQDGLAVIPRREHFSDYPTTTTLDEMWEYSDHVVVGRFEELKEVRNMCRNPADPSQESETDRFLGQVYTFTVEEVLKGSAEGEILINIPYMRTIQGEFSNAEVDQTGKITKEATEFYPYRVERLWDYYIEPEMGQQYVLFLSYGESTGRYFPAVEPYRISLAEDGAMSVESTLLLPENELAARREATYQAENGMEFQFFSHAFDVPFDTTTADMTLQDFLKQISAG